MTTPTQTSTVDPAHAARAQAFREAAEMVANCKPETDNPDFRRALEAFQTAIAAGLRITANLTESRPSGLRARMGRGETVPNNQPHEIHDDVFEDAHMAAAGAIMGARMAGKAIPPWSADMNEAFRSATAEAFDAGFRFGQEATR